MARSLTDVGPAVLVAAAWTVTPGAHVTALVTRRTLFIALRVVDVPLVAFYLAARDEMTGPVLSLWLRVLLGGLVATLLGTADMALDPGSDPLLPVTLAAWMVLPGVAYLLTGRAVATPTYRRVYLAGASFRWPARPPTRLGAPAAPSPGSSPDWSRSASARPPASSPRRSRIPDSIDILGSRSRETPRVIFELTSPLGHLLSRQAPWPG